MIHVGFYILNIIMSPSLFNRCSSYSSLQKTHKRKKKLQRKKHTHIYTREHANYTIFFRLTYNYRVISVEWYN